MFSILYVDDEPGLLEIGKLFLEQGGRFSVETVTSAQEALGILHIGHYDAIISDYQMPMMDGIEFLKRVRASGNRVPFIIFTGRGREEIVIQALNEGADFYLQKGGEPVSQFAELGHKLQTAILQRTTEASVRDHERREADIINFLPDATFAIDIRGIVIAWNRAMEKMTGVPAAQVLGRGNYEYALPFYHERRPILIDLVLKDDPDAVRNYPAITRDGTTLFSEITIPHFNNGKGAALWFTASPLFDRQGTIVGAIESIREITERKQVEEALYKSEKFLNSVVENIPDMIFVKDARDLRFVRFNKAGEDLLGYTREDLAGKNDFDFFPREEADFFAQNDRKVLDTNLAVDIPEEKIQTRLRGERIIHTKKIPIPDEKGNPQYLMGISEDITEQKKAERELAASGSRLRRAELVAMLGHWEFNLKSREVYASAGARALYGLSELQWNIEEVQKIPLPEYRPMLDEALQALVKDNIPYDVEFRIRRPNDGKIVDIHSIAEYNPAIQVVFGVIQDITGRKEAEDAIRESEQKYRTVFETTGTATVLIENDGMISLANSEFARLSGYPKEELEGLKKWTEFVVQEDLDRMLEQHRLRRQNQQKALPHYEFRFRTRAGEIRDIYLTIDIVPTTTKSVASLLDITERKRVENSLISANQEYLSLLDQIQDVYYRGDAEGRLVKASKSLASLIGYNDLSECLGRSIAGDFYYNPDDRNALLEELNRNGKVTEYEVRLKRKDGSPVLVATSSHLYRDSAGAVVGIEGTFHNITEQRRQEHNLRTQLDLGLRLQRLRGKEEILEACLIAAIDISGLDSGGIYLADESGINLILSRNLGEKFLQTIVHYEPGSANAQMVLAGKPVYVQFNNTGITHTAVQEREGLRALAIIPVISTGRVIACLNIASHTRDDIPEEARIALETIATQIGAAIERVRADEALLRSEERYRNVVEDQTEFISRFMPDGTHVFVNDAYCRYFGLKRDEILGHRFRPAMPPEDRERMNQFFKTLTPGHPVDTIAHRIIMPDSSIRWQRWSDRAIFDTSGKVTEYQSVGRDITDTKEAEIALQASEDRFRRLTDNAQDMIYRMSLPDGRYEYISRSSIRLTGYTPEEFYADPGILRSLIHPDWQEYFRQQWSAMLAGNVPPFYEFQIIDRTGSMHWVNQRNVLVTGQQGQPTAIEGIVTDITERRKTEDALRESERHLRLVTDNTVDQISRIDKNRIILDISPSAERLTGFKPEDMIGQKVTDYIHPDDMERILRETRAVIDQHQPSVRLEYRYRHRNGGYRWFESECRILYTDAGEYDGAVFVSRDITDRRLVEAQLRENRERFQNIFENSPLGIAIVSPIFTFRMVNRQFCAMLKYPEEELLNKSFTDITHPDHLTVDITESKKVFTREREIYKTEKKYLRKDGSILWASLTASPVKDNDGTVLYTIALIEDISDRKQAEERLVTIYREYQTLLDQIQDIYYRSDSDGRLVRISRSMADLLGYHDTSELIGKGIAEEFYFNPDDRKKVLEEIVRNGKVTNYEVQLKRKDGTPVTISASSHFWYHPDGTIGGVEGTFRDITEQKRAERTIAETTRKTGLLSSITRHDVANQVAILRGFAKVALMKKPDPVIAGLLEKIDEAGSTIARQIAFTKSYQELGMQAPGWQRIRDIVAQQKAEGISLSCTCDAEVFADPMLERVFFNLIDNAVRHGEKVTAITVSCRPDLDGLVISVRDDGVGVPPEIKEKIFEKGYGKHTGFGLFLAREILVITGITIKETGTHGKGARFEITVPKGMYRSA